MANATRHWAAPPSAAKLILSLSVSLILTGGSLAQTKARDHRGGTIIGAIHAACGSIDPHINYTECFYPLLPLFADGLVGFSRESTAKSFEIVPDLAETLPEIEDGGTSYIFTLRRGIHFSDGREVSVADAAASLRRMFKVIGPNSDAWFGNIVGGPACVATPATCSLAGGVIADPATRRLTIHLRQPDPEFLYRLALPLAAILPADTPAHDLGITPPIATGPYRVTAYQPQRELGFDRNPYFQQWSAAAQPAGYADHIIIRFGSREDDEINAILRGQIDWTSDPPPLARLPELGLHYPHLLHIDPTSAMVFVPLYTRLPPFDNPLARQAAAWAISKKAAVNLHGGPALGTPLCQMLPQGVPGFLHYCPYTNPPGADWQGNDLSRARDLVTRSGTRGMHLTVISEDTEVARSIAQYVAGVFSEIGWPSGARAVGSNVFSGYVQNTKNRVLVSVNQWYPDYALPSDYLYLRQACISFHEGVPINLNFSGFCDPAIDRDMARAIALWGSDRDAAISSWQDINRRLTDNAAEIPLFQINSIDLSSSRLGNYRYSQVYGRLLAQAWVK